MKDIFSIKNELRLKEIYKLPKFTNIKGLSRDGKIQIDICDNCNKVLDFDLDDINL
jgi:hypothetical protein